VSKCQLERVRWQMQVEMSVEEVKMSVVNGQMSGVEDQMVVADVLVSVASGQLIPPSSLFP